MAGQGARGRAKQRRGSAAVGRPSNAAATPRRQRRRARAGARSRRRNGRQQRGRRAVAGVPAGAPVGGARERARHFLIRRFRGRLCARAAVAAPAAAPAALAPPTSAAAAASPPPPAARTVPGPSAAGGGGGGLWRGYLRRALQTRRRPAGSLGGARYLPRRRCTRSSTPRAQREHTKQTNKMSFKKDKAQCHTEIGTRVPLNSTKN
jgi:hypothetical protein